LLVRWNDAQALLHSLDWTTTAREERFDVARRRIAHLILDHLVVQPTMEAMKEKAKQAVADQLGEQAPGYIKPCFACCGGPVGAMEKFTFVVPADKQEDVKKLIAKYKEM